jgi:hypothetical protein
MAKIQRDTMPEKNRRQLLKALAALEGLPPERWPRKKAVPLEGDLPVYLLILPEGFRAFIAPTEGNGIEVHSLTHERELELYRQAREREGNQG